VKGSVANYVVNFNQDGSGSVIFLKLSNNNLHEYTFSTGRVFVSFVGAQESSDL
jgi:hypothetical protein